MAGIRSQHHTSSGRLADKVAIVTGSSSGLGRAIALAYIDEGAKVVCADLNASARHQIEAEAAKTTLELLHEKGGVDRAVFRKTDVSKGTEVEALVGLAVQTFGRLDIIVNNAGTSMEPTPIHEATEEVWDRVMDTNARSVFLGSKYAIAQMLRQQAHPNGDRGWIINMASMASLVGVPMAPQYCAAKGAVAALTKQVAVDYGKHRIHCNAICPGYTQTAMVTEAFSRMPEGASAGLASLHPLKGLGQAEDIAGPAVFLASQDAQWVTGILMPVDGGFTAQ